MGYTGLIGTEILSLLEADLDCEKIICLGRRPPKESPKIDYIQADLANVENLSEYFNVDSIFCSLGTTIKKAGSRAKFSEVDFHFVYHSALAAKKANAGEFLLVSSLGADPNSIFFYNRVKGEVERDISRLSLPAFSIFRPSLLLGKREEFRTGEKIGEIFGNLLGFGMIGPLEKWKPIMAKEVALAMIRVAKLKKMGIKIYESDEIRKLAIEE